MALRPVLAALCLVAVAACGGGSDKSSSTPTASPTPTAMDPAAAKAAITTTWETFFNPAGTVADHVALLQNGPAFTAELTANSKDPAAKDLAAKVTAVVLNGDAQANVTYDLLGKGGVKLLPGAMGAAVYVDGAWKVSKLTYCQLITLQNPKVSHPGCA